MVTFVKNFMALFTQHRGHEPYYGIFNDSFPPILDGVTLTVQNYVNRFVAKGLDACVVTPWNPVSVQVGCPVIKYFSLPISNRKPYRYGSPKLDPFIWSRLRKAPFRILHAHCPFSSGRLAVYVKKHQNVPLIGTFHSKYKADLEHSFHRVPWMVPIIMRRILNFLNACDEVWIPQAQVEETVREYGYKGPLTVVENGSDMADVQYDDNMRQEARKKLGVPDDGVLQLLFVGQHIWEKGLAVIMDALEYMKGKIPFRMNFVGNGYALGELRERVRRSGLSNVVTINGLVNDRNRLRDFYCASDLFLFPSFYDNAPLVVREAAAFCTPSVLLEGSTAAEVITDEHNGFLTHADGRSYADLIMRLDADRATIDKVGRAAKNSLISSWDDVADEVLDRYNVLLKSYHR